MRKGFTLIELIIVIAIFVMLGYAVVSGISCLTGKKAFRGTEQYQTAPRVSTPVYNDEPPVERVPTTRPAR